LIGLKKLTGIDYLDLMRDCILEGLYTSKMASTP
jgi:hypothetical protein